MFKGYDISSIQGNVDFQKLANNGISFCILRGYIGNDGFDPDFNKNLAAAKSAGLKVGVYNFCYILPTDGVHANRDPVSQAQLHYQHCGSGITTFADIEWPLPADFKKYNIDAAFVQNWTLAYLQEYKRLAGSVSIYTFPDFAKESNFANNSAFAEYPLWMANYSANPTVFAPWTSSVLIQTGQETMVGHTANVDVNQCPDLSIFESAAPAQPVVAVSVVVAAPVPVVPETPSAPIVVPVTPIIAPPVSNSIFQMLINFFVKIFS